MNLESLEAILSEQSGNKFCVICGTPFKPRNSKQKTCGSVECQIAHKNSLERARQRRLREENPEEFRKKRREEKKREREKAKELDKRDKQLKEAQERWERIEQFDKTIADFGGNYGEYQRQKTLAMVPKIDVNLGGKYDTSHSKDNSSGSR